MEITVLMILESLLLLDREEEFELGGQLLLAVETVRKVYSSYSTIGVDGHPQGLDVVAAVCPPGEVWKVELDLVPALV